jgi:hypothetical protein
MRPVGVPLALALVFGCGSGRENSETPAPEPSPATAPAPAAETDDDGEPENDSACSVIQEEFRRTLETATGQCVTDDDCGCFSPVAGGCGGITDSATTARLGEIEARFHAADCPWPNQCGPWACVPFCEAGRCSNRESGGAIVP